MRSNYGANGDGHTVQIPLLPACRYFDLKTEMDRLGPCLAPHEQPGGGASGAQEVAQRRACLALLIEPECVHTTQTATGSGTPQST